MFCKLPQRDFIEFSSSIERESEHGRIPFMGTLELTYRCNLNCCHCYCNLPVSDPKRHEELKLNEIKRVIDEIVDSGCLWLLLTGGEPLVRKDFWDIYYYSLRKGLLVEIFTNATLINEETAKKLSDLPPLGIEISIYGSNHSAYDKVTQVDGSFINALKGIKWLKKYKVGFSLKTMVTTLNLDDLESM